MNTDSIGSSFPNTGSGTRQRGYRIQSLLPTLMLLAMFAASAAVAQVVTGVVSDRLSSAGEKQYVTLYLPQDGALSYSLSVTGSSNVMMSTGVRDASLMYYLADGDGGWMRPSVGANGSLANPGGPYPLKAGNYAIELLRGSGASASETYAWTVSTSVTSATRTNDAEPNNRISDAGTVTAGSPVTGHLGYTDFHEGGSGGTDDSDWWMLTLAQPGSVSLTLSADASFTAVTAGFKSSGGITQSELTLKPSTTGTLSQSLSLGTLAAGTYYVEVYRGNAGTGYGGYGSYALEVTSTAAAAVPPSGAVTATGPLTAQTLTLQNMQISSTDLSGGVSVYIVALLGNAVLTFGPNGWSTEILPYQSGVTTAPGTVTLVSALDLSGIVGAAFFLGYGNGSGAAALNDMLEKQKFVHLHTITATTAGGTTTNLLDLSLWNIYGTGQSQGSAILIGDQLGGDFNDTDKDGNPANVWSAGVVSDASGFGFDVDWAVSKGSFSAPLTVLWNGCLPYSGPDSRFILGRKNPAFTNRASSPDPVAADIYIQGDWTGHNPTLGVGTATGQSVRSTILTETLVPGNSYDYAAICGDFKVEWISQVATFYFNGSKIADIPYASGYGEPFGIALRSFANPIKVNSFSVTQP